MNSPLPPRETLTVEFKSDRNKLSDREIDSIRSVVDRDRGKIKEK